MPEQIEEIEIEEIGVRIEEAFGAVDPDNHQDEVNRWLISCFLLNVFVQGSASDENLTKIIERAATVESRQDLAMNIICAATVLADNLDKYNPAYIKLDGEERESLN